MVAFGTSSRALPASVPSGGHTAMLFRLLKKLPRRIVNSSEPSRINSGVLWPSSPSPSVVMSLPASPISRSGRVPLAKTILSSASHVS